MRILQSCIYALLCVILIAFSVIMYRQTEPEVLPAESIGEPQYIYTDTDLRCDIYYRACKHLQHEYIKGSEGFANRSYQELESEGWYIYTNADEELCLYREEAALCTADSGKYHIVRQGDSLIIVKGPKGYDGRVEGKVKVRIEALPRDWQNMLKADGVEFANYEDLMTALESLEEYE